jgi:hypothetical protein
MGVQISYQHSDLVDVAPAHFSALQLCIGAFIAMFARRFTVRHRHSPFAIAFGSPFAIRRLPSPSAFPTLPSARHSPFAIALSFPHLAFTLHHSPSLFAVRCSLFAVRCSLFVVCCFPSPMLSRHCSPCRLFCHLNGCRRQSGFPSPSAALDFPLVMELCSMECGGGSRQMVNGQWPTANSAL